ncbi:MAG: hypothetical protein SV186_02080 [Candidatus Nanohaloarchaea archaeon]|nr:hypothetical protein [Candidatus Nanohaloarchaea archaeon]
MTDDTTGNDLDMDRRTFLKSAGALGISASAIDFISEDKAQIGDITYNPQEEVPYVAGWDYVTDDKGQLIEKDPFYNVIGKETWRKHRQTDQAVQKTRKYLQQHFSPEEGVLLSITDDNSSPTDEKIKVMYDEEGPVSEEFLKSSLEELQSQVLTGKPDIPLEVAEHKVNEQVCQYEDKLYTEVPGGAPITELNSEEVGTAAASYYHPEHGQGWATAAHVVNDTGNPIAEYAVSGTAFIGESKEYVKTAFNDIDVAYIEEQSNEVPVPWIANKDYSDNKDLPVKGKISNQELREQKGNTDWHLHLQGDNTCRDHDYVSEIIEGIYGNLNSIVVGDSTLTQGGDSGGPIFRISDGDAYMAGVIRGDYNGNGTVGTSAERTEEVLDGNFMTP